MFVDNKIKYYLVREILCINDVYNGERIKLMKKIPKNNKTHKYIFIRQLILTKKEATKFIEDIELHIDKYIF